MPKDSRVYLEDILASIEKIERYTSKVTFETFEKDDLLADAVTRNLEIIGEAVKNLPEEMKEQHTDVSWKKIAGLRDILIHAYGGIELSIIWDIVQKKVPELKKKVKTLL
ncbi:MAG: DUF86 domain-containing protein [Candidatus Woesearchaeota archaeon]|nr:DUF86 domain-containing protein [Candidatus Woesearchaeota archaeon]